MLCRRFPIVLAVSVLLSSPVEARRLADIFSSDLESVELAPVGRALANTVAGGYPIASASSSVSYEFNPELETFERRTRVLGPLFGERAETVGAGEFAASLSYSYLSLDRINGDDVSSLESRPTVNGEIISVEIPEGVRLADGRFTNFLPLRAVADITVEAQLLTPGVTYGITPDLDLNITLPLIRSYVRVNAEVELPDPRLPQFALAEGQSVSASGPVASGTAEGVGDLLLRAKYTLLRGGIADVAAQLGLSLPTGREEDLHGTGNTLVQPTLIVSRLFADRFQPLLNVGMILNTGDVGRSIVRWAVGGAAQVIGPLSASLVFLGRHELESQAARIRNPFFLQIERNDMFDASVGLRYLFLGSGVVSVNALMPLNDDGFRPQVVPTVQVEYSFDAPW